MLVGWVLYRQHPSDCCTIGPILEGTILTKLTFKIKPGDGITKRKQGFHQEYFFSLVNNSIFTNRSGETRLYSQPIGRIFLFDYETKKIFERVSCFLDSLFCKTVPGQISTDMQYNNLLASI